MSALKPPGPEDSNSYRKIRVFVASPGDVAEDGDVAIHSTSDAHFCLCANTDPQRDSLFTKSPSDVLDHASESSPAASSASTRRRNCRGKASNAPGRRSSKWMPR